MARFRREIEAMQKLDHPHVMPILEIDPAVKWYAMPLAERSLRGLHEREPADWPQLQAALSALSGALMHSHPNGYVHRDASPDNVLQLYRGHWVLSDFGLVMPRRRVGFKTKPGALIGTEFFSAPEVLLDPSSATPASDAWSVGALASWFTGISKSQNPTSNGGRYWWSLINGTLRMDPGSRWEIDKIAEYLAADVEFAVPVPSLTARAPEECVRCGRAAGVDAAERCLACGYLNPY